MQCNIDWLLMGKGLNPDEKSFEPGSSAEAGLTSEEMQVLDLFNRIPKSERHKIISMIKAKAEEYDRLFQELLESRSGKA